MRVPIKLAFNPYPKGMGFLPGLFEQLHAGYHYDTPGEGEPVMIIILEEKILHKEECP